MFMVQFERVVMFYVGGIVLRLDDIVLKKREFPVTRQFDGIEILDDWRAAPEVELNKDGIVRPTMNNVFLALTRSKEWFGKIAYNEFTGRIVMAGRPPYDKRDGVFLQRQIDEQDHALIAIWLAQSPGRLSVSDTIIRTAITAVSAYNKFHPVRDYLVDCYSKWDGVRRIDNFLSGYFGVNDSAYTRTVSAKTLIGCVARIMQPGCKMDNMLIIEGDGGIGKSAGIQALLPNTEWFVDSLPDILSKEAPMQLTGKWILELAELAGHSRREKEAQKAFITRRFDTFRPAYGTATKDFPRQTVFIGTTNQSHYLNDETGNRRYWPVTATSVDVRGIARDRDMIWGEAVYAWKSGEAWHLVGDEINLAVREQEDRFDDDPWTGAVMAFIRDRNEVTREEIVAALGIEMKHYGRLEALRIASIMRFNGYKAKRISAGPDRGKYRYVKTVDIA